LNVFYWLNTIIRSNGVNVFTHPNDANEITIWNPNTHKHIIIPFLPIPIPNILESEDINCAYICVHGFGFDSLSGYYKLLRISYLINPHEYYDPQVRLFSLKTNSWKIIPTMPFALFYAKVMGVFVENSLHWIMVKKLGGLHPSLIVAFNLTLEIFSEVPLPDEIFKFSVAVLGGCLCMIVNYKATKIDVWVMKEYGCRDGWCKLFTLVKSCFNSSLKWLMPLGYSSDGKKVLSKVEGGKLFWYDLESEQVTSYVEGIPNLNEAMICVGSLVPHR